MLAVVTTVKLLTEIALLALLGQWAIGLLSGPARDHNLFYRLLQVVGHPLVRAARWLARRVVLDRHLPLLDGLVLLFIWGGAAISKIAICLQLGVVLCN